MKLFNKPDFSKVKWPALDYEGNQVRMAAEKVTKALAATPAHAEFVIVEAVGKAEMIRLTNMGFAIEAVDTSLRGTLIRTYIMKARRQDVALAA